MGRPASSPERIFNKRTVDRSYCFRARNTSSLIYHYRSTSHVCPTDGFTLRASRTRGVRPSSVVYSRFHLRLVSTGSRECAMNFRSTCSFSVVSSLAHSQRGGPKTVDSTDVGLRAGVVGGLPGVWLLAEMVRVVTAATGPLWFRVVGGGFIVFSFIVLLFGFAALVGLLGAKVGAWLVPRSRSQKPPISEREDIQNSSANSVFNTYPSLQSQKQGTGCFV